MHPLTRPPDKNTMAIVAARLTTLRERSAAHRQASMHFYFFIFLFLFFFFFFRSLQVLRILKPPCHFDVAIGRELQQTLTNEKIVQ